MRAGIRRPQIAQSARGFLLATRLLPRGRAFSYSVTQWEKQYTKDHEWIEASADKKTCTLGISRYASDSLGDPTYIELPTKGDPCESGDVIGAVESVKAAADVISPVNGTILSVNEALDEKPALLKDDPEGEGWIATIEVKSVDEEELMDAAAYKTYTEGIAE
jgi:glycine cleavage system H protein